MKQLWSKVIGTTLVLIVTVLVASSDARAQDAPRDTLYEVELRDGTRLHGTIERHDSAALVLISPGGVRMELQAAQIREVRLATGRVVRGHYWLPDPNPSRLFFTQTARSLGAGRGYVGTLLVVLPYAAVGIGDRITVAAGAPFLIGWTDVVYLMPKVEVLRSGRARIALGGITFFGLRDEDELDFSDSGIAYGVATFGTDHDAITAGLGYFYAGDELIFGRPAIVLGAETQVGSKAKFMTENYLIPGYDGALVSGAVRMFSDRLSVDVGAFAVLDRAGGGGCCLPMINFSYTFGRR